MSRHRNHCSKKANGQGEQPASVKERGLLARFGLQILRYFFEEPMSVLFNSLWAREYALQ